MGRPAATTPPSPRARVTHMEAFFLNKRNHPIFTRSYIPAHPTSILLFHHGYPQHSGLWDSEFCSAFRDLASAGVAVFAHDAAGFGRSAPPTPGAPHWPASVASVDALVDDVFSLRSALVAPLEAAHGGRLPVHVGGVSMGGLVAIHAVLRAPDAWAGVVLESPALAPVWTPLLRLLHAASPLLERVVPAWVPGVPGPPFAAHTPAAATVAALRADPLNPTPPFLPACILRVGTARALFDGMQDALERAHELRLPLLVFSCADDGAVCPAAIAKFVASTSSPDKTHVTHPPGSGHCLLLGPACGAVVGRVAAWAAARSPVARSRLRRAAAVAAGVNSGGKKAQTAVALVATSG